MCTRSVQRGARLALASLALVAGAGRASAQVLGSPVPISLNVNQTSTLTVTIQSGAVQTLTSPSLSNQITNFPAPVQILTAWDFRPNTVSSLSLVAFFAAPATAMAGPNGAIASSRIQGQISSSTGPVAPAPTTWTSFTSNGVSTNGVAGGSLALWTFAISGNAAAVRRNQQLNRLDLRLNLTGITLPSGTYTGTLVIRAMAL
jgi:hypothetical protein